jgi:hypothetical protein
VILAHPFERTMRKIIGIAPLIIALILGTSLSSQAQIVTVQPVNFDGGFSMYKNQNGIELQKPTNDQVKNSTLLNRDINTNSSRYPDISNTNEYYVIEYEVKYSICSYNSNKQTDLQSGSYYCILVGCKFNTESVFKDLN